jgi:hypothetical protein
MMKTTCNFMIMNCELTALSSMTRRKPSHLTVPSHGQWSKSPFRPDLLIG